MQPCRRAPRPCVVALIPARGGSKGLPGKNLAPLGGRPLVAWSVEAALACPLVDRVVVSTDSPEIAAQAERFGAEVPFLRPAALGGDTVTTGAAVRHALDELQRDGYRPEVLAVLYPTSPFRPPGLLDRLVGLNLGGHASVVTARRMEPSPVAFLPGPGAARPVGTPPGTPLFRCYGLYEGTSLDPGQHTSLYHEVTDPVQLIDIDGQADLDLARAALEAGLVPWAAPDAGGPR